MGFPEHKYLTIEELSGRWEHNISDILRWAEAGHIEVKVKILDGYVEEGKIIAGREKKYKEEKFNNIEVTVPPNSLSMLGRDPSPSTSFTITIRDGENYITYLTSNSNIYSSGYNHVLIHFYLADLLVDLDEVKRFEREYLEPKKRKRSGTFRKKHREFVKKIVFMLRKELGKEVNAFQVWKRIAYICDNEFNEAVSNDEQFNGFVDSFDAETKSITFINPKTDRPAKPTSYKTLSNWISEIIRDNPY